MDLVVVDSTDKINFQLKNISHNDYFVKQLFRDMYDKYSFPFLSQRLGERNSQQRFIFIVFNNWTVAKHANLTNIISFEEYLISNFWLNRFIKILRNYRGK